MSIFYQRKATSDECLERWGKPVTERIHNEIIKRLDLSLAAEPASVLTVDHIKRAKAWLKDQD